MKEKNVLNTKIKISLVLLIMLMSSTPNTFAQAEDIQNPNKIVIDSVGIHFFDYNLDPATSYDTGELEYIDLAYEGLVTKDPSNNDLIIGLLASDWIISQDSKTYTFNLRKNIFYHDGTPFNAYTMKYSLDRLMIINDHKGPAYLLQEYIVGASKLMQTSDINISQANTYLNAKGINVIDDYTIEIKLIKPFNFFLNVLCLFGKAVSPYSVIAHAPANYTTNQGDDNWGMISLSTMFPSLPDWTKLGLSSTHDPRISGIVPQSDADSNNKHVWMSNNMIGTGPYKLDHFNTEQVELVKNTNWHGTFAINSVSAIIWNFEQYINTTDFRFRSGLTDYLEGIRSFTDLVPSYIDISTGKSIIDGINAYIQPLSAVLVYGFNLNESISTKYVSPALNIATTWNETHITNDHLMQYNNNNTYFASITNPFTSLKFRQAFSMAIDYNSFIAESYYNVFAIRAEGIVPYGIPGHQDQLIEKGFIPNFDLETSKQLFQDVGWRGNITIYDLGTPKGYRHIFNLLVQSAFASMDVGININIVIVSPSEFFSDFSNYPLQDYSWADDYEDPLNSIYPYYYSKGYFGSILHYYNPVVDSLINQLKVETNNNKRIELTKQIEENVTSDYAYSYMINRVNLILTRSWLYNIESSGSLQSLSNGLKFQYISKGEPLNISSSNSQLIEKSSSSIPGFELNVIFLAFTIFIIINKKKKL